MSVKHRRIVVVGLTLAETRTVIALLEGCDDSDGHLKRETSALAKRFRIADSRARNTLTTNAERT